MINPRKYLIGKTVKDVEIEEDELWLNFGDGWHLIVYNSFVLVPEDAVGVRSSTLMTFKEREKHEFLTFDSGATVTVDLRDDAYRGPEAMQLIGPEALFVIWN